MMDRVQYANILYNTIIPSHLAPNERSTAEKPLLDFIASNIPNAPYFVFVHVMSVILKLSIKIKYGLQMACQ